ncbi:MAG: sigma 54-interacting transcriptional regulator, partial [Polyangiaceae bacterium]
EFGDIVYRGRAMAEVIDRARKLTARSVSVLIEGESGTGKELLARAIHEEGPRRGKPFIPVNCGALPANLVESLLFGHKAGAFSGANKAQDGAFRSANSGTLFLDEVGELPLDAQVKLLRVLQEKQVTPVGETESREVDVRVIAATNRDLFEEHRHGRFREDLFYRLAVAVLRLPPLRDRQGDLSPLIDRLLEKANLAAEKEEPSYQRKVLSARARGLLLEHSWPGNVRELENTLMRATVWSEGTTVTEADIRSALLGRAGEQVANKPIGDGFDLDEELATISRHYIERAMEQASGNKTHAARLLGLKNRQNLSNRLRALKMVP